VGALGVAEHDTNGREASRRPPRQPVGFDPRSGHVEFVLDKVALVQVFSEYFGVPCQFSFHKQFHIY
jgi:hypothetical protein